MLQLEWTSLVADDFPIERWKNKIRHLKQFLQDGLIIDKEYKKTKIKTSSFH